MRVLAQGVAGCRYQGFQRAVEATGCQWTWWQEEHTPAFDVFHEIEPDVVFCMNRTRALSKCIMANKTLLIQGNEQEPFKFEVGPDKIIDFSRLVDTHVFNPQAAMSPAYVSDVCIVGKPTAICLKLCMDCDINIKIVGDDKWAVSQYLGVASLTQKQQLYSSSHVVVVSNTVEAMRVIACQSAILATVGTDETLGPEFDTFEVKDIEDLLRIINIGRTNNDKKRALIEDSANLLNRKSYDFAWNYITQEILDENQGKLLNR